MMLYEINVTWQRGAVLCLRRKGFPPWCWNRICKLLPTACCSAVPRMDSSVTAAFKLPSDLSSSPSLLFLLTVHPQTAPRPPFPTAVGLYLHLSVATTMWLCFSAPVCKWMRNEQSPLQCLSTGSDDLWGASSVHFPDDWNPISIQFEHSKCFSYDKPHLHIHSYSAFF